VAKTEVGNNLGKQIHLQLDVPNFLLQQINDMKLIKLYVATSAHEHPSWSYVSKGTHSRPLRYLHWHLQLTLTIVLDWHPTTWLFIPLAMNLQTRCSRLVVMASMIFNSSVTPRALPYISPSSRWLAARHSTVQIFLWLSASALWCRTSERWTRHGWVLGKHGHFFHKQGQPDEDSIQRDLEQAMVMIDAPRTV